MFCNEKLEQLIQLSAHQFGEHLELHRSAPQIRFVDHLIARRLEKANQVSGRNIIYLDTNAWKCIVDFRLGNSRLTQEMISFAHTAELAAHSGKFLFPIGLPTFFELDSMTSESTHNALLILVDELCAGFCLAPFPERISIEMEKLRRGDYNQDSELSDYLRSPVELLGIPFTSLTDSLNWFVDENTFNKALFDTVSDLPFSFLLCLARESPGLKWNNNANISELNIGKDAHKIEAPNLITAIAIELRGVIETYCKSEQVDIPAKEIALLSLNALHHWHTNPKSKAFPTLRILSSLFGLMKYDKQRRYKDGDPTDFLAAASALPVSKALFTDRRLNNLLTDSRLLITDFAESKVVSGFAEMASFLGGALDSEVAGNRAASS
jgi:hypothetical protein